MREDSYVYVWLFDDSRAFVFWGDSKEPERLFDFCDCCESELNDWLRTLATQPKLDERSLLWPMFSNRARTVVHLLQKQLQQEGLELLSSRDRSTVKAGHQKRRPVFVTVRGKRQWFKSVSSAAHALGLDKSTVTLNCQNPRRTDFQYDEPKS
jgi:hypothetical protein